jgi:hypothetical protein
MTEPLSLPDEVERFLAQAQALRRQALRINPLPPELSLRYT